MKRAEFLSKFWKPYPAIKESALDVSSALLFLGRESDDDLVIGGRLFGQIGELAIGSGGETCAIQFDETCKWIDSNEAFDPSVLESDDIVLIKAKIRYIFDAAVMHVFEVQLLAPALKRTKHNFSSQADSLKQWSEFVQVVRDFFLQHEFIEAQTPTLVPAPGTEPYLDVFTTEFVHGRHKQTFYLPTSPEFHLKKLLTRGLTRIFEIRPCFRNGEVSEHHQPEFQMLEWYRAYAGLNSIVEDIQRLLTRLSQHFPERKVERLKLTTTADLFKEHCSGFILTPDTSRDELYVLGESLGLDVQANDTWDDLFFRIVIAKIEPAIDPETPTIVRGYPKPQAALARLNANGWAERFEFYWKGLEIANAFDELNDPQANEARFKSDLEKRVASGREKHSLDHDLIDAFYSGMPPAGGIALGVERLYMALFDVKDISQIKAFAVKVV